MKNPLNFVFVTAVLLRLVLGCVAPAPNKGVFADAAGLENEIRNKIGAFPTNWEKVKFTNISNDSISIWITYSEKPELSNLESDTKRVAQAVLEVLQSKDYDAKKHWLFLTVRGNLHCSGCDNRPRPLGETTYDYETGSFKFSKDWFGF